MLLLPLALGVAASDPTPWQLVLGAAAVSGYLASATVQAWTRARRPVAYLRPIAVYGAGFAVLGLALVLAFPVLLASLVVVVPAAALVFRGARPGTRRDLVNSLAQVAEALVLVPAAAVVSGAVDPRSVVAYTAVAGAYLAGSVLVVRSVLRERGNERFRTLSVAYHLGLVVLAVVLLPWPYAVLAGALAARAAALPIVQARRAGGPDPLRPVHVGMIELAATIAVIGIAFAVPI